jgi:hypothetical protein
MLSVKLSRRCLKRETYTPAAHVLKFRQTKSCAHEAESDPPTVDLREHAERRFWLTCSQDRFVSQLSSQHAGRAILIRPKVNDLQVTVEL